MEDGWCGDGIEGERMCGKDGCAVLEGLCYLDGFCV